MDLETTGLSPRAHRAVDLAVVLVDGRGRVDHEWSTLLNPQGPVGATHIHGIRDVDVVGAPTFDMVAPQLARLLAGRALVGHNVSFDAAFLKFEFGRAGWGWPTVPTLCTLQESFHFLPRLDRRRLADCCTAAGIRLTDGHSALGDARATAMLLECYLNHGCEVSPLPAHRAVLGAAAIVSWPTGPGTGRVADPSAPVRALTPRAKRVIAASRSVCTSTLLESLTLADALDDGAPEGALSYLETVAEVLEDGHVTDDERSALADIVDLYELEDEDVKAAHRGLVRALAREALEDGVLARREKAELRHIADLLDVPERHVKDLLDGEEEARLTALSAGLPPLPEKWQHGDPLRVGQRVAFTGCDDTERASLEESAQARGVRVTGSVSGRTAMLVTDGSFTGTKAAAAAQLGTRVVDPGTFALLLDHLQPAAGYARPLGSSATGCGTASGRGTPAPNPSSDPTANATSAGDHEAGFERHVIHPPAAVVRRWARDKGLEVGVRGRLSAEVWDAYNAAHAGGDTPRSAGSSAN